MIWQILKWQSYSWHLAWGQTGQSLRKRLDGLTTGTSFPLLLSLTEHSLFEVFIVNNKRIRFPSLPSTHLTQNTIFRPPPPSPGEKYKCGLSDICWVLSTLQFGAKLRCRSSGTRSPGPGPGPGQRPQVPWEATRPRFSWAQPWAKSSGHQQEQQRLRKHPGHRWRWGASQAQHSTHWVGGQAATQIAKKKREKEKKNLKAL